MQYYICLVSNLLMCVQHMLTPSVSYVVIATGSAMGTMKMSVMGAALVAIFLSIGLLL